MNTKAYIIFFSIFNNAYLENQNIFQKHILLRIIRL